jgi:hypothetical protein
MISDMTFSLLQVKFPFSLSSPYENARSILGENPMLWCLPFGGGASGDGLTWQVQGDGRWREAMELGRVERGTYTYEGGWTRDRDKEGDWEIV